jgi:probable rRNA maturation factor
MSATDLELDIIGAVPTGLELEPLQKVFALASEARDELNLPSGVIDLKFVDDAAIRELNRDYSGHDYATDVLAFNYLESGQPIDGVIGEMVVSTATAARQAEAAGSSLGEEVALLVLHGTLHIGGYDHQTEEQQDQMQLLQQQLMEQAGYHWREFSWNV